jgi:hypothetical protein
MELAYFLLASAVMSCAVGGKLDHKHGIRRLGNFNPQNGHAYSEPRSKPGKGRLGLNLLVAGFMLLILAFTVGAQV